MRRRRIRGGALIERLVFVAVALRPGELAGQLRDLVLRRRRIGGRAAIETLILVAIALRAGERRLQAGKLSFKVGLVGLGHRQLLGKPGDLRIEAFQRRVLALHFLLQIKLDHDEDAEQKNDAQNQRRQRVDEAGPVIHAAFAAARPCQRHAPYSPTFATAFTS